MSIVQYNSYGELTVVTPGHRYTYAAANPSLVAELESLIHRGKVGQAWRILRSLPLLERV